MLKKDEVMKMTRLFQGRCLNLYIRAFMDFQEREISPELRDHSVALLKAAEAGNYAEAAKRTDTVVYLFKILLVKGFLPQNVYESLVVDGSALSVVLNDAAKGGVED